MFRSTATTMICRTVGTVPHVKRNNQVGVAYLPCIFLSNHNFPPSSSFGAFCQLQNQQYDFYQSRIPFLGPVTFGPAYIAFCHSHTTAKVCILTPLALSSNIYHSPCLILLKDFITKMRCPRCKDAPWCLVCDGMSLSFQLRRTIEGIPLYEVSVSLFVLRPLQFKFYFAHVKHYRNTAGTSNLEISSS